eukprot:TRINITY_DN9547_c0_g1_i2.p1 TRINITY_DN9547_c0_g1~~TRINITY_DN9547_c0_g1_i2.p1  ORF type:complete len:204 (-),score=42.16 TRINITY_DN9547_c0_g1_i2:98-709(-)
MASKYLKKYQVPPGFNEILHSFIREVLREQPSDIVDFGVEYFTCLNEGREYKPLEARKNQETASKEASGVSREGDRPSRDGKRVVPALNYRFGSEKHGIGEVISPKSDVTYKTNTTHPEEKKAAREALKEIEGMVEAQMYDERDDSLSNSRQNSNLNNYRDPHGRAIARPVSGQSQQYSNIGDEEDEGYGRPEGEYDEEDNEY